MWDRSYVILPTRQRPDGCRNRRRMVSLRSNPSQAKKDIETARRNAYTDVARFRPISMRSASLEFRDDRIARRPVRHRGDEGSSNQGRMSMKKMLLLATLLAGWPGLGLAQTMDDLVNSAKNTDN